MSTKRLVYVHISDNASTGACATLAFYRDEASGDVSIAIHKNETAVAVFSLTPSDAKTAASAIAPQKKP